MARFIKNQSAFEFQGDAGGPEGNQPVVTFKITEENFFANVRDAFAMLHNCVLWHKCLNADKVDNKHASDIIAESTTFDVKVSTATFRTLSKLMPIAVNTTTYAAARANDISTCAVAFIDSLEPDGNLTLRQDGVLEGTLDEWNAVAPAGGPIVGTKYYLSGAKAGNWVATPPSDGYAQAVGVGLPILASNPLALRMLVLAHKPETNIRRITVATTLDPTYSIVKANTDGGSYTVTLHELATASQTRPIHIKNTGSSGNQLFVAPAGLEHLLGANSNFTLEDNEALNLWPDTTDGWD